MRRDTLQARIAVFIMCLFTALLAPYANASAQTRIVALGDSLTAGYGLQTGEDFASKLQAYLLSKKINVKVENAGVSGDTTAGGLARLDWAIAGDTPPDLVLVALGANDMLRGLQPSEAEANLRSILEKLKAKNIPVLLIGMKSPMNMGPLFRGNFDGIYPKLAKEFDVKLYPFFLEGVAMKPELNLEDGLHPNTAGIAIIVQNIGPIVVEMLEK